MKFERMIISPDTAREMLEQNVSNRKLRKSVVNRYAKDMIAGEYLESPAPIAFDTKGGLLDGQHRLAALVKADISLPFWVATGVKEDVRSVVDIGFSRTKADSLELSGEFGGTPLKDYIATVQAMMRPGAGGLAGGISRWEIRDMLQTYFPTIQLVLSFFPGKRARITHSVVFAAITRAACHLPKDTIRQFCSLLYAGEPEGAVILPGMRTVFRFRNLLLDSTVAGRGGNPRREIYYRCERVIKAFAEGEELGKIYNPSKELFPLPCDRKGDA